MKTTVRMLEALGRHPVPHRLILTSTMSSGTAHASRTSEYRDQTSLRQAKAADYLEAFSAAASADCQLVK